MAQDQYTQNYFDCPYANILMGSWPAASWAKGRLGKPAVAESDLLAMDSPTGSDAVGE
jgi:hypothetical protein